MMHYDGGSSSDLLWNKAEAVAVFKFNVSSKREIENNMPI